MVSGRLCCLVLLFGVYLRDVEASDYESVIHKKVGDNVELLSRAPTRGVTVAQWKYGLSVITKKDRGITETPQFKGRLYLNNTTFDLTVKGLTLQDSGDFSFISEVNDQQRKTVTIKLQVHEPITTKPVLTGNSTWNSSNESCTVLLECSTTSKSSVMYTWTVRNQTFSVPRLQYILKLQDGDTTFTCTVYNFVSQMSESKTVKCSNNTQEITTQEKTPSFGLILGLAVGGCVLVVLTLGIVVGVCHSKQSRAGSDSNDLTVYADISEVAIEDGTSPNVKPCSVYETIDNRVNTGTPGMINHPQTVYDKIQLSRVRKPSVSPYQEIA